ncbi:peptidoglycan-binding protein [Phyllobacterium phragmitis]|uniref:Peptidoglycan-binding protein n=1 Tax=Phyllobacterium phragmitis TaxID=2670329 RepID=A0A2S9IKG5_9HYPH|nr:peptidoglycan-binding protein [Phyllobacterium phragmitis]PRD41017.1 peptidoglycan-binding protein [Phyllobacterium phragmitis]
MKNQRSILENLNAQRARQMPSPLDELNRTLEELENRLQGLDRASSERQSDAYDAEVFPGQEAALGAYPGFGRDDTVSRGLPGDRQTPHHHQQENITGLSAVAEELKQLRGELRQEMSSTMRREFELLNRDMERLRQSALAEGYSAHMGEELSRISENVQTLSERTDTETAQGLRRELEELKRTVQTLAREESLRRLNHRWDTFDERFDAFEQRQSARDSAADPAVPPHFMQQMDERLDEISRAILSSSVSRRPDQDEVKRLERIEAQLASLAGQIEAAPQDHVSDTLLRRMSELSQRVDALVERNTLPDRTIERLVEQMDALAGHVEKAARNSTGADYGDLEDRLSFIARKLEDAEHRAAMPDPTFIKEIDRRFEELAQRLDDHHMAGNVYDVRLIENLEGRLEDLSQQLSVNAAQASTHSGFPGHEIFRNLEAQVAEIARHLSQPNPRHPELEDIRPRLDSIERSLTSNRETVLDAARQAAEDAIRHVMKNGSAGDAAIAHQLANDLKSLEALARGSDERSTRTFETIHDTLLKIVDRLGKLEQEVSKPGKAAGKHDAVVEPGKSVIGKPPSLQFEAEPDFAHSSTPRSPAAAAAEAALAAIKSEGQIAAKTPDDREKKKSSMFGGLAKAVKGRGKSDVAAEAVRRTVLKAEPSFASAPQATDTAEPPKPVEAMDSKLANLPLEPGSGTPDLNTIMKRVRDERRERGDEPIGEAGKADFIIAARRAAQAAAAESERLKKDPEKARQKKHSAVGGMLHRQRKPILMAIGAIMIAMAGLQVGTAFLSPGDPQNDFSDTAEMTDMPAGVPGIDTNRTSAVPQAGTEQPNAAQAPESDVKALQQPAPIEEPMAMPASPDAATVPDTMPGTSSPADAATPTQPSNSQATERETTAPQGDAAAPTKTAEKDPLPAIPAIPDEAGPAALREAAAKGDPKALFEIGNRYTDGRGVQSDYAKAGQWYELSAAMGFAPAEYRLGNFNEKGLGVPRDPAKAKTWYQLAAQQGNASAMHNLAVLFAMGPDGTPDNDSAARWFSKAAELGVKDSQFNLGILSAKGLGMPQNFEESYKWFALAARAGDKDAEQKRDEVAKILKPEQLERAKSAVELWKVKPLDEAANSIDVPDAWQEDKPMATGSVDMKKAVRNIQLILKKSGYDAGAADGMMGAKTREAIAAFQKAHAMKPTGEVDQPLVEALLKQNQQTSVAAKP